VVSANDFLGGRESSLDETLLEVAPRILRRLSIEGKETAFGGDDVLLAAVTETCEIF
jgi:hypothetical protein